jgi:hypothetical protein
VPRAGPEILEQIEVRPALIVDRNQFAIEHGAARQIASASTM